MAVRQQGSSRPARSSQTHIALLRGVNVGGKNRLAMDDLVKAFSDLGCLNVQTYIQSGNVVFAAPAAVARRLPPLLSKRIAERFGIVSPVVVRSAKELAEVVAGNPFVGAGADEKTLHVVFLASEPDERLLRKLDPRRSPGDSFLVVRREIYLYLPKGVARTKLTTAYFDSALATTSTMRNWRTVRQLQAMTEQR